MLSARFITLIVLLLCSLNSNALGLGEITVTSALNEPFEAEITLTGSVDLSTNEMVVQLASAEAFERLGISREYILTQLRFTPIIENESAVILVRSETPIREPFLNFLLDVQWPRGQMMKEYTVFLNPE